MSFNGDFLFKHHERLLQLLKSWSAVPSLKTTKPLHALAITLGPYTCQPIFVYNNIISQYAFLRHLSAARKVFDIMTERNPVSFNSMISAYGKCGDVWGAWDLFSMMRGCGFSPTPFALAGLLSCQALDLCGGSQLQALVVKNGLFDADAFVGTALLGLYARSGCVSEAVQAFEDMPRKSLVTWNSIISLYAHYGLVEDCMLSFRELLRLEASLSDCSFVGVLSGLEGELDSEFGEQIHGLVIKSGFDYEVTVVNSLINMYVKCVRLCLAEKVFQGMHIKDVVSWNTIIGALERDGSPLKALDFFFQMSMDGVMPNQTTLVIIIASCSSLQMPMLGAYIHAKTIKKGFESDVFVGSALVDFYAKCDKLVDSHQCFDGIYEKNVVSWNALILGYASKFCTTCSFLLLDMLQLGYRPNEFTFSAILKSSVTIELQQLHCFIIRMGYEHNVYVLSSLMTSYAKNGLLSDALPFVTDCERPLAIVPSNIVAGIYNRVGQYQETLKLLSVLEEPDVVSWNIMIAASAHSGDYKEVFELFRHMQMTQIYPDNYTFVSLLSVSSKLSNLALGSSVHGLIIKTDFSLCDTFVCNVLVNMYGECGCIKSSVKIFDGMADRNLITWTSLISALGVNGYSHEALENFQEMEFLGFKPDGVAFIAILTVCRHAGLVKEGMELFRRMKCDYGLEPKMDHYHCMVDLLARHGKLKEAEQIIAGMAFPPDALIWRSFLEGCKRHITTEGLSTGHGVVKAV
ncbi:Pentatricopeptide repeat (PPR) superfamily protein, putative [Theobroma cacao]|uniref:Pentatricopeptide repeat (PPR) superfamily protein, putative n=1 Tax=Theobroma cacao TaxID=3641 RepID=A0A061FJ78_THECC|nr:Pentatricopeptide repeat (PPR) superfamily protein, putative [Theobroma cacao]